MNYWGGDGKRSYHHTAPVNAMYGLHESLVLLHEEGIETAWARHNDKHLKLAEGLQALGFEYLVKEEDRLPQLNSVIIPEALKPREAEIRKTLLDDYKLEIGAGLGALAGDIWRIGLMGYGASDSNVSACLNALRKVI